MGARRLMTYTLGNETIGNPRRFLQGIYEGAETPDLVLM
jgi:hypothetical protein